MLRDIPVRTGYASGMPGGEDKARINRARRAATRQGFAIHRGRTRDPLATSYGWHVMRGKRKVARFSDLAGLERWLTGEGRDL
jgi:hypothetical protein